MQSILGLLSNRILSDYRRGYCQVLIATDVASRGLDIRDIRLVVNYSMPSNIESYIHRIGRKTHTSQSGMFNAADSHNGFVVTRHCDGTGRTGRAADKGTAVTFFTHDFFTPEKVK